MYTCESVIYELIEQLRTHTLLALTPDINDTDTIHSAGGSGLVTLCLTIRYVRSFDQIPMWTVITKATAI